ncbi:fimbrial protein [Rahnella selenatireducens]|uniref:fimbrial protein n=1 Tax=Rahnella selenatireducens TaxID=3389797 RepID=UPI00396965E0
MLSLINMEKAEMERYKTVVFAILFITTTASAADTAINIQGKVIASPCVVNSDTINKLVELPKVEARSFSAGSGGDWVDFDLDLENCPVYLKSAVARFSGVPDENEATMYKNDGSAKNIALQMSARTTNYGNGSMMKVDVKSSTHSATFPLSARMYSPKGDVGKGTFSSTVGVDFTYQ